MPVEVRELIIKTEIKSRPSQAAAGLDADEVKQLKQQIIDECLRFFKSMARRDSFNR